MKTLFILLCCLPLFSFAQRSTGYMLRDTLYTSNGSKIYKGQKLQFGVGNGSNGKFRYVNMKSEYSSTVLTNNSILVKKMKNFGISALGNGYIEIIGQIVFQDGSKGSVDLHIAFDLAIEPKPGFKAEMIVPTEDAASQ